MLPGQSIRLAHPLHGEQRQLPPFSPVLIEWEWRLKWSSSSGKKRNRCLFFCFLYLPYFLLSLKRECHTDNWISVQLTLMKPHPSQPTSIKADQLYPALWSLFLLCCQGKILFSVHKQTYAPPCIVPLLSLVCSI